MTVILKNGAIEDLLKKQHQNGDLDQIELCQSKKKCCKSNRNSFLSYWRFYISFVFGGSKEETT